MSELPSRTGKASQEMPEDVRAELELNYQQYFQELVRFAAPKISAKMGVRFDPEDVVQSACGSLIRLSKDPDLDLSVPEVLWRFLGAIAFNKIREKVQKHGAKMRSVDSQQSLSDSQNLLSRAPSAEHKVMFYEEVKAFLQSSKDERDQTILGLTLLGYTKMEVGRKVGISSARVGQILKAYGDRHKVLIPALKAVTQASEE